MQNTLDQAITVAAAAEATYTADLSNVTSIQEAIDSASAPLLPAKQKAAQDAEVARTAYLALADAAKAAADAIPVPVVSV